MFNWSVPIDLSKFCHVPVYESKMDRLSRFTDRSLKVLALAKKVAEELGHQYVGTEHLLIALSDEGTGVASHILSKHGLDPKSARKVVQDVINPPADPRIERIEKAFDECQDKVRNVIDAVEDQLGMIAAEIESIRKSK